MTNDLGPPRLVVHNIDGRTREIFRKSITEADPELVRQVLANSALSAFTVGQCAARSMLAHEPGENGQRGTIIFTNASAAMKGFPNSAALAMACHAKSGLAQSMARELMPQGIHVAHVPIDAAIGWTQDALFDHAEGKGPLAAVIYNAGNNAPIPFEKLKPETFEQFWRVGCFGAFLTAKRAVPLLKAQ